MIHTHGDIAGGARHGPHGVAALQFLEYKQVNMDSIFDLHHGVSNDIWATVDFMKDRAHFTFMSVVDLLNYKPHDEALWFQMGQSSSDGYWRHSNPKDCFLWQCHKQSFFIDFGVADRIGEEGFDEMLWARCRDVHVKKLIRKGHTVSPSRWLEKFDAAEEYLPLWTMQLLEKIALVINNDMLSNTSFKIIAQIIAKSKREINLERKQM